MATLLIAGIDWDEHAQGLRYSEGNEGHSGQCSTVSENSLLTLNSWGISSEYNIDTE